jgi:glycosyltransferase involved in cell wall biosynthesis
VQESTPKKIKVLHLIDSGGLYGAEKMLLALVDEQSKMGIQPIILSSGLPEDHQKPLEIEVQKRSISLKVWRMKAGLNVPEAYRIIKWAKSQNVDVLHAHGYKFNILLGLIPKFLRKLPLVTTVHGYVHARRFSAMWLYELLDRLMLQRMDGVVFVSEANEGEFRSVSKVSRFVRINNGIPGIVKLPLLDQGIQQFIGGFKTSLLAIGRLSPEKGFSDLIAALALIYQEKSLADGSIGLVIVGEGRERQALEEQIKQSGLSKNVMLAGYHDNAGDLVSYFDALVMPSKTEGLPITLLEAMRSSAIIIATKVGGIPAVVGDDSALLISPASLVELKEAVLRVFNNKESLTCLACQAKERFLSGYTSEVMADKYARFYSDVLGINVVADK